MCHDKILKSNNQPTCHMYLFFTPIRGTVKYYEVVTMSIIRGVGKETSPQQILMDLIVLLIGPLKSVCHSKSNKPGAL